MTKRLSVYFFSLLITLSVVGEPFKLQTLKVGTTTYTNVTILGANTTDLYFSHSLGFANVKLKYVSADLQKRYDYDPKAAERAERIQIENDILYQSALANAAAAQPAKLSANKKPSLGSETGLADPISEGSLLGKPGPNLEVDKWISEKPALEGKYVLISFWAPWSVPCRQWITEFNALQKKYSDKLVVVGVSAGSESEIADLSDPRIEYASAIDAKAKLSAATGVTSIPFVLFRDPKGIVLYQGHPGALTDKKLQAILSKPAE
jgi:cytochrome c biogenesis protein CcmG/thiol:disulfide interchange protein DsbE